MSSSIVDAHVNDPLFKEALKNLQQGEWEEGLEKLDELKERYPSSHSIHELQKEMQLKAKFDIYEENEEKKERRRRALKWVLGAVVFMVIISAIYASSSWFQQQLVSIRLSLLSEVQAIEVAVKYSDAQAYLTADRPLEAEQLLEEIYQVNPNYPGLDEARTKVNELLTVETSYETALQLIKSEQYQQALQTLAAIEEKEPGYKDVSIRIQDVQKQILLDRLKSEADIAFKQENWDLAISRYESLQAIAASYNADEVKEQLMVSYINGANRVLDERPESIEALAIAEDYFRKALVLKPMDSEVLKAQKQAISSHKERLYNNYLDKAQEVLLGQEDALNALEEANKYFERALSLRPDDPRAKLLRSLAQTYIDAQEEFYRSNWDEVIQSLEYVYGEDEEYANGTALQTLFDAYMERGSERMAGGDYEAALEDFKRAAEIASSKPEGGTVRLYWAKIKIAEVYGILGDYQEAVQLYNDATLITNLITLAQGPNGSPTVAIQLEEADRYANLQYYRTAYRLYNQVLPATEVLYSVEEYTVQEGDYLSMLANRYATTVQAILDENNLSSPSSIDDGENILIPTIKEQGQ